MVNFSANLVKVLKKSVATKNADFWKLFTKSRF
jgi:hypothetical protein